MSRPTTEFTIDEVLKFKDMEWTVPEGAVSVDRESKTRGQYKASRWDEVAQLTSFDIRENDDGILIGSMRFIVSDDDIYGNHNPGKNIYVKIWFDPAVLKTPKPPKGTPESGAWWGARFTHEKIESLLQAIGETGILVNRRFLKDYGALYDLLNQIDVQGRLVSVNLEYPAAWENATDPDVRYFASVT